MPGATIDYKWVAAKLGELAALYQIEGIAFDRWRIADLQRDMDALGVDCWIDDEGDIPGYGLRMVPHGQGFKDMGPAVEALFDALENKSLRHVMHPVLTWNAANAALKMDTAELRKFAKNKSRGRIDGIVALAMALNLARRSDAPQESVYEQRGLLMIG